MIARKNVASARNSRWNRIDPLPLVWISLARISSLPSNDISSPFPEEGIEPLRPRSLLILFRHANGRVAFSPRLYQLLEKGRRAPSLPDLKEENTLGRIIGLIGCTFLVIAALRLANLQHVSTQPLKGGEERVAAQSKLSPRQHFKRGKELYQRGRYFDSLPHLEEASMSTTGLSATERRQTDDCLKLVRSKVQAVASDSPPTSKQRVGAVVRGQSDPWGEDSSSMENVDDVARDKVEQLMIQAKAAYKSGDKAQAIKLAQLANHVAKSGKLKFGKGEATPGEFLAKLLPVKLNSTARR